MVTGKLVSNKIFSTWVKLVDGSNINFLWINLIKEPIHTSLIFGNVTHTKGDLVRTEVVGKYRGIITVNT